MPTYYSYYNVGKDPTTKYEIEGKQIVTYKKSTVFFSFIVPWKKEETYEMTQDVEIAFERVEPSGNGVLTLRKKGPGAEGKFPVYGNSRDFINEVKRAIQR